jgi:hypothetical protein
MEETDNACTNLAIYLAVVSCNVRRGLEGDAWRPGGDKGKKRGGSCKVFVGLGENEMLCFSLSFHPLHRSEGMMKIRSILGIYTHTCKSIYTYPLHTSYSTGHC